MDFIDKKSKVAEWYNPYVDYAFSYQWYIIIPFHQHKDSGIGLARGQAAKIIADATGKNYPKGFYSLPSGQRHYRR
ncbi:hypothetical protein [Paenibacillus oleatilyticus]|uniref:hypothetical protein n=1 Tax=Paenibacillus oleatilyticus TaxID=2594886 RepID=UPI001C1FD9E2|nr:hypothetical protein [Paenibacillus oleatilyticus]MBU7315374.1 hypothetical protein [Paenibacillus oleatilyticus]